MISCLRITNAAFSSHIILLIRFLLRDYHIFATYSHLLIRSTLTSRAI